MPDEITDRRAWIAANLETQADWTLEDYQEFYERDVRFLLTENDRLISEINRPSPPYECRVFINGAGRLAFNVDTPGEDGLCIVVSQLGPDRWQVSTGEERDWDPPSFEGTGREAAEWVRAKWHAEGFEGA